MKKFIKCVLIRMVKTMCQTAIGVLGASKLISEVSLEHLVSATILSGIISILTSISAGLPEADGYSIKNLRK